jgi:hypothetical protein
MSTIASGNTSTTGLVQSSDTTGNLVFQTNGTTTALTLGTNQNATFAGGITVAGAATFTTALAGSTGASLVLIQSQTASGSATLDFTSGISSTYLHYLFFLQNVKPVNANAGLYMRFSTDGGINYQTTNYTYNNQAQNSNGTDVSGYSAGSGITSAIVFGDQISNNAGEGGINGIIQIFDPAGSNQKFACGNGGYLRAASLNTSCSMAGLWSSTTAVNAVRFLMGSGNIASGTISFFGVKKS